ncbi:hypothetical protein COOONC_17606 [Cooperia oncophora]
MNQLFHMTKDDFRYLDKFLTEREIPSYGYNLAYFKWLATSQYIKKDHPCLYDKLQYFYRVRKEAQECGGDNAGEFFTRLWIVSNQVRRREVGPELETKAMIPYLDWTDKRARDYLFKKFPVLKTLW